MCRFVLQIGCCWPCRCSGAFLCGPTRLWACCIYSAAAPPCTEVLGNPAREMQGTPPHAWPGNTHALATRPMLLCPIWKNCCPRCAASTRCLSAGSQPGHCMPTPGFLSAQQIWCCPCSTLQLQPEQLIRAPCCCPLQEHSCPHRVSLPPCQTCGLSFDSPWPLQRLCCPCCATQTTASMG